MTISALDLTVTDIVAGQSVYVVNELARWTDIETWAATVVTDVNNSVLKTGNQTIAGIKTFSSSPIVPTPTTDMQASTKKYVDDNTSVYTPASYAGEESITFPNGLIIKNGVVPAVEKNTVNVSFGSAFPTAIKSIVVSRNTAETTIAYSWTVTAQSVNGFSFYTEGTTGNYDWIAIGY